MSRPALLLTTLMLEALLAGTACSTRGVAPGRPSVNSEPIPPTKIMDFNFLYASNCAGCHGPDGRGGPAIGLGNPVYLAIADDSTITRIASDGVPGTAMPAFAQHSGGMLTGDQIQVIVRGIRARWANPDALHGEVPPPYAAQNAGDPTRGATAFGVYCSSCHGANGQGGRASCIVDGSYLALVSDQGLRTIVIAGRPELGDPDWRNDVAGKPMSAEDVSDVVAWLAAQRPQFPGQPYTSASRVEGGIR
jgi:cytochrome c oxidase cbb3-type subunit III